MRREELAAFAAQQCASAETTAHHGGGKGRPFWNPTSYQFMYVPAFQFHHIPGTERYRYRATDEKGGEHVFEAENCTGLLTPVWKDIPEGVVELRVYALDEQGNERHLVGARTFYRLAPFTGDYPPAPIGYREAAERVYDFAFEQPFMRHWLTDGTPDPDYDRYVYPSKMIPAVITAMIDYARLRPERADDALRIAKNAADYLIGITRQDGPTAGVPPTYWLNFREHPETRRNLTADERIDWVMMIYPAHVGTAYLQLAQAAGERRYFDAALRIGEYYRDHVEENGTWYLLRSITTGEVISPNYCAPLERIIPFLKSLGERTGDPAWDSLADGAMAYTEKDMLSTYDWEGQFEDSPCSANYSNLSHYGATALVRHYCTYHADDPAKMAEADDLMRFAEDQFVIWGKPSPWNRTHFDTSIWQTPCGLEQYNWHVPIDASTADITRTFLAMYRAGRGELHLAKARALADSIVRSQRPDGRIPTHWMTDAHRSGEDFWINCMFDAARTLSLMAGEGNS